MHYLVPCGPVTAETSVKRSLFICSLGHTPTRSDAESFIRQIREKHPDANHNCWAFVAGAPDDPSCWGSNDDGEPKGCAGKPMFQVLHHSGIGEICVVVSRYFGGIKLGTGGMARAYSGAVGEALGVAETTRKIVYIAVELQLAYSQLKTVQHLLEQSAAVTGDIDYGQDIRITADIPQSAVDTFSDRLRELTQDRVRPVFKTGPETS